MRRRDHDQTCDSIEDDQLRVRGPDSLTSHRNPMLHAATKLATQHSQDPIDYLERIEITAI